MGSSKWKVGATMSQQVTLEDGSVHVFPDDASPDEMTSALSSISPPSSNSMGPLTVPQAEAGYLLNSVNGVPGINLLKEAGAGIRGIGAVATGGSFSDEYAKSRANQEKLMQNEQEQLPPKTPLGALEQGLQPQGHYLSRARLGAS